MKYTRSIKNVKDSVKMHTGKNDYVARRKYNLKMMDNFQHISPKKIKRYRSAFTTEQVNYLENQFKKFPYIGNAQRKEVAFALNIPERAVKIWFQNRRMREKKESIVKEFDDDPSNQISFEFVKDQSSNSCEPSANDQKPYSLTLLTDGNQPNCGKFIMTNSSQCNLSSGLLIADSGYKTFRPSTIPNMTYTPPAYGRPPRPILPNNYMNLSELSIGLCKKYKDEPDSPESLAKLTARGHDIKYMVEGKPINYKAMEQMEPEDLSSRKTNILTVGPTQVPNIAPSKPGYISVIPTVSPFYTQPYYPASGVLWKPLNVVPGSSVPGSLVPCSSVPGSSVPCSSVTGSSVPVSVSNNISPMAIALDSEVKKSCSCDCHVKPVLSNSVQQQSPNPQYIITTVQFPKPSEPKL